jgi:hypothetical protein
MYTHTITYGHDTRKTNKRHVRKINELLSLNPSSTTNDDDTKID